MTVSLMLCKKCRQMKKQTEMAKNNRPKKDGSPSYYSTCRECKLAADRAKAARYKKTCAICGKTKTISNFSAEHPTWCSPCAALRNVSNTAAAKALAMKW